MLKIVSHTRAGVHYLASLFHQNLETGAADYEQLHYSHSRVPDAPYIHLYRHALPTLLSVWRARTHLGIASEVTFAQLLRTPMVDLPRSQAGNAFLNGVYSDKVCAPPVPYPGTALDRWLERTELFEVRATLSFEYTRTVEDPLGTVEAVQNAFDLQRRGPFRLVLDRVGWWPAQIEQPEISEEDLMLIRSYLCRSSLYSDTDQLS